jgi:hypothetical protein
MAILRIKLVSATGQPMSGQSVKATGCDALQTNTEGLVQFLLGGDPALEIEINGSVTWAGSRSDLSRDEVLTQTASGFVRASGA